MRCSEGPSSLSLTSASICRTRASRRCPGSRVTRYANTCTGLSEIRIGTDGPLNCVPPRDRPPQIFLGCEAKEIALLGPTAYGLGLTANGLSWETGDEVVYYAEDYPSNVYPWSSLADRGVRTVELRPEWPGVITWKDIEPVLSDKTKLVALASCHFLSGHRIDLETIGENLKARNVLFSVDGIQTVGAFATCVEHVDFLSVGAHKWMLGPSGAGFFYVKSSRQDLLRPTFLGATNVVSPEFVAQQTLEYCEGAERFESGEMNLSGIAGMEGALRMLFRCGIEAISERLTGLRDALLAGLRPLGYQTYLEAAGAEETEGEDWRSAILTVSHPGEDMESLYLHLKEHGIVRSLRKNRSGDAFLRLSPHFYNSFEDVDRVVELVKSHEAGRA